MYMYNARLRRVQVGGRIHNEQRSKMRPPAGSVSYEVLLRELGY